MPPTDSSPSTFSLSNQSLKLSTAADITPHLAPLESSTQTTHISINGNTLGVEAAHALSAHLSTQRSLTSINLADIFTGRLLSEIPPALSSLLTALAQCPRLERIDLSDNAFGLNTVAPLVAFLRQHVPLRHLILNNNGLGPHAGVAVAEALVELAARKQEAREKGVEDVPELETVVCGRNRLESGSAVAWARAYTAHAKGMRTVRMVQNGIRPEGIVVLVREGLGRCGGLEVLDLQDNTFTVPGSKALADVVGGLGRLRELGLGDCLLKSRGAFVVAEALGEGRNGELQTLRMQYAEMDGKGFEKLVAAVEAGALPGLRRVEVNGNRFPEDDQAVERLREILEGRKDEAGEEAEDEEAWGVDELDDMEEDEDDEDDEDVEELGERESDDEEEVKEVKQEKLEREKEAERVLQQADQEEAENVAEKKDPDVDALADALEKKL